MDTTLKHHIGNTISHLYTLAHFMENKGYKMRAVTLRKFAAVLEAWLA